MKKYLLLMFAAVATMFAACTNASTEDQTPGPGPDVPTPGEKATLSIELGEVTATSVSGVVTPSDENLAYIINVAPKAEFDEGNAVLNDLAAFKAEAEAEGVDLATVLAAKLHEGKTEGVLAEGLASDTEYVLYAYGFAVADEVALTDIATAEFTTEALVAQNDKLKMEITEVTATSASGSVLVDDEATRWVLWIMEKEDFDSFASDEEVIADDFAYLQQYIDAGYYTSMEELLDDFLAEGSYEGLFADDLDPESSYVFYAYTVELDGTVTSPLVKVEVTTPAKAPVEKIEMSFQFDVKLEGFDATVTVTPSNDEIVYYFDALTEEDVEECGGVEAAAIAISESTIEYYGYYGYTPAEIVEGLGSLGVDAYTFSFEANKKYYIYAHAWSEDGEVISDVAYVTVETPGVEMSDNKITINVESVEAKKAYVSTTATNNDPYFFGIEPAAEFAGMTDAEIIETIIDYYGSYISWSLVEGSQETTEFNPLDPETEYLVLCFGYEAGCATTDLVKTSLTTIAAGNPADCTFTFDVTNITTTGARLEVTPSDDSVPFYFDLAPKTATLAEIKAQIEAMVQEDFEEYEDYYGGDIAKAWAWFADEGPHYENYSNLTPNTEYVPYAVCIDTVKGGYAADFVFGESFKTLDAGSVTPCEVTLLFDLPSALFDNSAYGDHEALGFAVFGTDVVSGKYGVWKTSVLVNSGFTEDEYETVVDTYGGDMSATWLNNIATKGYHATTFINLDPETSYTAIVKCTNSTGGTGLAFVTCSTAAAPVVDPNVPIVGNYNITCSPAEGTTFSNDFQIVADASQEGRFILKNFGFDDCGTTWYGYYDAAASTLTLDGVEFNYPDDGNYFGQLYGYWNSAKTQIYGYFSFDPNDPESEGSDPCVFAVDPTTKKLSALNTQFVVPVFSASSGEILGYAGYYAPGTPVTYVENATASKAGKKTVKEFSTVKINSKIALKSAKADNAKVVLKNVPAKSAKNVNAVNRVFAHDGARNIVKAAKAVNTADIHNALATAKQNNTTKGMRSANATLAKKSAAKKVKSSKIVRHSIKSLNK